MFVKIGEAIAGVVGRERFPLANFSEVIDVLLVSALGQIVAERPGHGVRIEGFGFEELIVANNVLQHGAKPFGIFLESLPSSFLGTGPVARAVPFCEIAQRGCFELNCESLNNPEWIGSQSLMQSGIEGDLVGGFVTDRLERSVGVVVAG